MCSYVRMWDKWKWQSCAIRDRNKLWILRGKQRYRQIDTTEHHKPTIQWFYPVRSELHRTFMRIKCNLNMCNHTYVLFWTNLRVTSNARYMHMRNLHSCLCHWCARRSISNSKVLRQFHRKTYRFTGKRTLSPENVPFHRKTYLFTGKRTFSPENVPSILPTYKYFVKYL